MNRTLTRTAAAAGGILLAAVGMSAPAYAGDHNGSHRIGVHAQHRYGDATLAEVQAWVDKAIAHRLNKLDRVANRIADSDRLSDEQRARWSDKIADARADLVDLRSAVAAADSFGMPMASRVNCAVTVSRYSRAVRCSASAMRIKLWPRARAADIACARSSCAERLARNPSRPRKRPSWSGSAMTRAAASVQPWCFSRSVSLAWAACGSR